MTSMIHTMHDPRSVSDEPSHTPNILRGFAFRRLVDGLQELQFLRILQSYLLRSLWMHQCTYRCVDTQEFVAYTSRT